MLHYVIYVISIFSLSQASILIKLSAIPPETLGFWRLLGASTALLMFRSTQQSPHTIFTNIGQSRKWITLTGVFFYLHLWSYFYAAQNTSIAHCMILFALNPLFTAIGAKVFFKEPLEKNVIFSYAFALIGLYFLVQSRFSLGLQTGWKGELSALASGILYSLYTLLSKRSRTQINNWDFGIGIYFVCALCFLFTTQVLSTPLTGYSTTSWLALVGTIIIPTLLGHSLFTYLMNYLNINWMSCGKLLEPTFSTLVAFLVFKEEIKTNTILAFVFTSTAVLFLFFKWEFHNGRFTILLRKKS
ncbi:MAG: DMT family transporter [Bdellovibrionaceae bacterium]|nr:DMT family transporter [Pseudobdellovibrionaceae bacterium]